MGSKLDFKIVTADGIVCEAQADFVLVPATDGTMGILPGHTAMLVSLAEGTVKYVVEGEENFASISGGVMSIAGNVLTILA